MIEFVRRNGELVASVSEGCCPMKGQTIIIKDEAFTVEDSYHRVFTDYTCDPPRTKMITSVVVER